MEDREVGLPLTVRPARPSCSSPSRAPAVRRAGPRAPSAARRARRGRRGRRARRRRRARRGRRSPPPSYALAAGALAAGASLALLAPGPRPRRRRSRWGYAPRRLPRRADVCTRFSFDGDRTLRSASGTSAGAGSRTRRAVGGSAFAWAYASFDRYAFLRARAAAALVPRAADDVGRDGRGQLHLTLCSRTATRWSAASRSTACPRSEEVVVRFGGGHLCARLLFRRLLLLMEPFSVQNFSGSDGPRR